MGDLGLCLVCMRAAAVVLPGYCLRCSTAERVPVYERPKPAPAPRPAPPPFVPRVRTDGGCRYCGGRAPKCGSCATCARAVNVAFVTGRAMPAVRAW